VKEGEGDWLFLPSFDVSPLRLLFFFYRVIGADDLLRKLVKSQAQSTTCIHSLSQERDGWMDGWMLGWGDGRPIFFSSSSCWKSTELTHCDDNTRECGKWCGITRSLFPPCRTKPPPHFFSIFFPNNSASLHVWNNPPPIWLFALPIQPIILKGSCRKKMKNIFFHDGENTISCRLFNHNKKIWKQMKGGDQKTDPETHRYINQIDCCRRRANQSSCVIFPPRHSLFSFILIHENS
jgi:hypothetical protein